MKILLTNHRLSTRSGTELYILEVSRELSLRGHRVAVFSTVLGELADSVSALGIPVVSEPQSCPFEPEVIHGQHHLEAMAALCAWPGKPALYFINGYVPWEERPPVHPRILRYLSTCHAYDPWVKEICGVDDEALMVLSNHIDLPAFPAMRPDKRPLRSALVYHSAIDPEGAVFQTIKAACSEMGWTLDTAGRSFSNMIENPGEVLPGYDVVFAIGRSALEAMACGCAVVLVNPNMMGDWVSPENFEVAVERNFSIPPNCLPASGDDLLKSLRSIRVEALPALAARIRSEFTLGVTVDRLEACYREIIGKSVRTSPHEESLALGRYLTSMAKNTDTGRASLAAELDRSKEKLSKLQQKSRKAQVRLGVLEQRMGIVQQVLEQGGWLKRRLWRKLRRRWEGTMKSPGSSDQEK